MQFSNNGTFKVMNAAIYARIKPNFLGLDGKRFAQLPATEFCGTTPEHLQNYM